MLRTSHILIVALVAAAFVAPVVGQDRATKASQARQLLLKNAINEKIEGTLAATLNKNQERWAAMTPEQRQQHRDRILAWYNQDPERQKDLIKAFEEFRKLSPTQQEAFRKRAVWLKKVVASLTPRQREALKRLPPAERAKRLLELKARLVDNKPATQPGK